MHVDSIDDGVYIVSLMIKAESGAAGPWHNSSKGYDNHLRGVTVKGHLRVKQ